MLKKENSKSGGAHQISFLITGKISKFNKLLLCAPRIHSGELLSAEGSNTDLLIQRL